MYVQNRSAVGVNPNSIGIKYSLLVLRGGGSFGPCLWFDFLIETLGIVMAKAVSNRVNIITGLEAVDFSDLLHVCAWYSN